MMDNGLFLELVQIVLFVGMFTFSTGYLIPKGVFFFQDWKAQKGRRYLGASITYCAAGVFILIYLVSAAVVSHVKSVYS